MRPLRSESFVPAKNQYDSDAKGLPSPHWDIGIHTTYFTFPREGREGRAGRAAKSGRRLYSFDSSPRHPPLAVARPSRRAGEERCYVSPESLTSCGMSQALRLKLAAHLLPISSFGAH